MTLSLQTKLIAAAAAIGLLIASLAVTIVSLSRASANGMRDAQEVGVGGALLGERIKLDVVQVQQWLTDISATRGQDGLNDGIDVAAEFAADFEVATAELQTLRPELAPQLDELRARFAIYHAVGIEMAEAYIAGGPAEGNVMMAEFDTAAASIGEAVDVLVDDLLVMSERSLDDAVGHADLVGVVTLVAGIALLLVVAGTGFLIVRSILAQLRILTDTAGRLAAGDIDVEPIPAHDRDPLGRLATAFNEVSATLGEVGTRAELIAAGDITSSHRIPGALGRSFDSMIGGLGEVVDKLRNSAAELTSAAGTLTGVAGRVGDNVEETAREATTASAAGDEVSSRVAMVAAAIEQMNASIGEVATNASEAARVANEAVGVAGQTSSTIAKLGDSSEEVGNVIKVIHSIAEQTNLLALNATIEAARAGEAGKGFAVVATEVKELADQTAKATQEISERIEAIQADTNGAVEANARIGETIDRINEISTTIASAVEEQSVTTAEISRNIEEAASSSRGIASSINGVATVAANTTASAEETRSAAQDMSRLADELTHLVSIYH